MKTILKNKKRALLSGVLAIMLLATAGLTLALLIDRDGDVTNTFTPSEVTCEVNEPGWNNGDPEKKNVSIKNTGDTDAFIRAAIVVTWQDGQGNIAPVVPVLGTDYSLDISTDEDNSTWFKKDGYYYFENRVPADNGDNEYELTDILIKECRPLTAGPEGYTLSVEIIADAIQADGVKTGEVDVTKDQPAEIAWGVYVNNNADTGLAETISAGAPADTE